ncbi:hypothetical protein M0802_003001 [Mischocyttarus mexicanus]|nr:hypothetical protein M0802_003001 [Mischocyttarus mexicanus]
MDRETSSMNHLEHEPPRVREIVVMTFLDFFGEFPNAPNKPKRGSQRKSCVYLRFRSYFRTRIEEGLTVVYCRVEVTPFRWKRSLKRWLEPRRGLLLLSGFFTPLGNHDLERLRKAKAVQLGELDDVSEIHTILNKYLIEKNSSYVLDIDLDFFSTKNPFKGIYSEVDNLYQKLYDVYYFARCSTIPTTCYLSYPTNSTDHCDCKPVSGSAYSPTRVRVISELFKLPQLLQLTTSENILASVISIYLRGRKANIYSKAIKTIESFLEVPINDTGQV